MKSQAAVNPTASPDKSDVHKQGWEKELTTKGVTLQDSFYINSELATFVDRNQNNVWLHLLGRHNGGE